MLNFKINPFQQLYLMPDDPHLGCKIFVSYKPDAKHLQQFQASYLFLTFFAHSTNYETFFAQELEAII